MDTKKPQYEWLFSAKFKKLSPVGYGRNSQLLNWTPCTQCANHESNKVERYSKINCAGWTGMPQGFQKYFVWNT